jgi:hypothetical protein
VFWLAGHAGAGKSTIAFSISQHYDTNSELLAANFFCSRQFKDTSRRKYIIPSIVYQLARHSNSFRHALVAVNQFGSCDEPDKQLKELLVEPWKRCLRDRKFQIPSFLIVIDALDEIVKDEGAIFLRDLLGAVRDGHLAGLRFLVTSRLHPKIVDLCNSFPRNAVCRLQEVDMADVSNDIATFLEAELPALRDEPRLMELAKRSDGLFIYAATAVRYINPQKASKTEQLASLVKLLGPRLPTSTRNPLVIDELYKEILRSAFGDLEEEEFSVRRGILHYVVLENVPVKVPVLSKLNPIYTRDLVTHVVNELYPVLYIEHDVISWYHASFPDFLFDSTRSKFIVTLPSGEKHTVDMTCQLDEYESTRKVKLLPCPALSCFLCCVLVAQFPHGSSRPLRLQLFASLNVLNGRKRWRFRLV